MIWHDLPIAIIDTETTGVDDNARIVEAQGKGRVGRLAKNGGKQ